MKQWFIYISILLLSTKSETIHAQNLKLHIGQGYMEHFTTGIEINVKEKHNISLLYGSNFFIKMKEFSSYMVQYEFILNERKIANFIPKIGIKSGYSVYTNYYYQWKLLTLIPFVSANYSISKNFDLSFIVGSAFSRELSMKRIHKGEIGWYRKVLPEIKLAILYKLKKK